MNLGVDFDQHLMTNNRDSTGEMTRDVVDALMHHKATCLSNAV
jgi:hypothetical protein